MKNNSPNICNSKKNPYPRPLGHFCFRPATPLEFPFQGVLVIPPLPIPWNFRNSPTWLGTPWKEYFRQKCLCPILLCER